MFVDVSARRNAAMEIAAFFIVQPSTDSSRRGEMNAGKRSAYALLYNL